MTILYCPELGERKPATMFTASLAHSGTHYFVRTCCKITGRGVTDCTDEYDKARGLNCYRMTDRAYQQLASEYDIAMKELLD